MKTKIVEGYMCKTDWDYEIGEAAGGTEIYASVEDLKNHRECVTSCGIVKVKVEFIEVTQPENRKWAKDD